MIPIDIRDVIEGIEQGLDAPGSLEPDTTSVGQQYRIHAEPFAMGIPAPNNEQSKKIFELTRYSTSLPDGRIENSTGRHFKSAPLSSSLYGAVGDLMILMFSLQIIHAIPIYRPAYRLRLSDGTEYYIDAYNNVGQVYQFQYRHSSGRSIPAIERYIYPFPTGPVSISLISLM